jgi:2-C-methyl-D-erythritol 4-phosphate cytidylyltransferase/2-C-methyl-D-erythritol 2,4-cyclodiphosphate synthase
MQFAAIIVAAGAGTRAGGAKQWRELGGKAVARWSLEALLAAGAVEVVVVIAPEAEVEAARAFAALDGWRTVIGGARRHDSVHAGLAALAPVEAVLIHDAARPFLGPAVIDTLLAALETHEAAWPAVAAVDTLRRNGELIDRASLLRAQTPQAFRTAALMRAWSLWPDGEVPTDDIEVARRAGLSIAAVDGDPMLFKLTHAEDFAMAERLAPGARTLRIGQGYDVHAFGPGEAVWLCGVRIDHGHALVGHSDADAGLHALTDALLGAIGEGDIGDHFPPSEPEWKGAASSVFLQHAAALIATRGGRVVNADVTLICEAPRIKPHRQAMRARIAELLGVDVAQVSVKATTTEGLGFTGRREGLAAQAVACVEVLG